MTSLFQRRGTGAAPGTAEHQVLMQVDLLLPETRAAREFARVKKYLVIGIVGVLALVVVGYGAASVRASVAEDSLSDAQSETAKLTAQQAKYDEAVPVLNRLEALKHARTEGLSTEILWTPYLYAIFAVMPEQVQLSSFVVTGSTPMVAVAAPADPLQRPRVTTVTFTGRSITVPQTAGWVDALNSIPGFQDAWVSSVMTKEDDEDGVYYEVESSVQVTTTAYANRFAVDEGK